MDLRQPQHPRRLVGAWLGVHVAKRLVGYRPRTGDLFAPAVALGMAIGRVGCLLTELPGTPTGTPYGITLDPAAAASGCTPPAYRCTLVRLRDRLPRRGVRGAVVLAAAPAQAPGETLTLYLAGYGVFRFLVEFVRATRSLWAASPGRSSSCSLTVPLLLAGIAWQARGASTLTRVATPVATHPVPPHPRSHRRPRGVGRPCSSAWSSASAAAARLPGAGVLGPDYRIGTPVG